ncbi:hypothetical protein H4582DRAFT_2144993 [Lactarius indigo]|nr:hypothetical protein H4582DRAFT_2144993 [Lactarius indigo]
MSTGQSDPSANGSPKRCQCGTAHDAPGLRTPYWGSQPRRRSLSSPEPPNEDDGQPSRQRQRRSGLDDDQPDENGESLLQLPDDESGDSSLIDSAYWKFKGTIIGRYAEMWDNYYQILNVGISRNPNVDEDYLHTKLQNQQYKKFLVLIEISPALVPLLQKAKDNKTGQELARQLDLAIDAGRKQVRRVDASGICGAISQWPSINWEPAYPVVRRLLGFNHNTSGELLCPVTLNWRDPSVRERLRRGMQAKISIEGFYVAYKHVFISPSSAKETNKSTRGSDASAALHFVTYESIAYVATLIRFGLSDDMTFCAGGHDTDGKGRGGFPYRQLYHELLEYKDLMSKEELEDLIEWWNEKASSDGVL